MTSCSLNGEEIGRLKINEPSHGENIIIKEVTIPLDKEDKISFWTEMDVIYEDQVSIRFKVEILKDNQPYGGLEIDPFQKKVTIGETKTEINGTTTWSFTGKNASLSIHEDGEYTFRGILVTSTNETLKIDKADVIIKK